MASNRKKTTTITELLPEEPARQANNEDPLDTNADLVITLTKVYRILANGKRSFCYQAVDGADEVTIQERYPNGGTFAIEDYNDMGIVVTKAIVDIEPKPMQANGNSNSNDSGDFRVNLLMSELQWMRQMITQFMLNGNGGKEATPVSELLEGLKHLDQLRGGKDPIDLIMKGIDLAGKVGGGGPSDWKMMLADTVKENLPAVLSTVQRFQVTPSTHGGNGNGNGDHMRLANMLPADVILKNAVVQLKKQIIGGLTPDLAVDWILRNGDSAEYQPVIEKVVNGGIDAFIAIDPDIANEPYRTWFTTAINSIKEEYARQSTIEDDESGENANHMAGRNGDGADSAVNAKTRARKSAK